MSAALAVLKGAAISSPEIPMMPSKMRFMAVPQSELMPEFLCLTFAASAAAREREIDLSIDFL
jgi:hypothetical protein